ncbi:DUF1566 domain-containing protein [Aquimarina sp. 2201CG1-2-11]|uniref:Lcl domain-containing protein n=1 Tax=Aquimarina discodermiae TaxID=3231043 RepID=UPI003462F1A0
MRKVILLFFIILTVSFSAYSQTPEGFKYQAVVRNSENLILNNQDVGIRLTIQQGAIGGTVVYTETFATTTNTYGLVNLDVGSGTTTDSFANVDWSNGPYYIETAIDIEGGTKFVVMGTSQLMSVPYALHSKTAENAINDLVTDADADPTNEIELPTGGTNGQVLATDGSGNYSWVNDNDTDDTNEIELPTGGTNGQVLATDGSGNYNWVNDNVNDNDTDATNEIELPTGGTNGQVLATDGSGNYNWVNDNVNDNDTDATNEIELPTGGTNGQVLATDGSGNYSWVHDNLGVYTAGTGIAISGGNVISTTNACGLLIGDTHQGGIIFYLDPSGCHGLISMATDQSMGIQWYNGSNIDTYAYGNGIGSGEGNAQGIRRWQGECTSCYASELCQDLDSGGFTDWYLPSRYELNLMYQNIGQGNALGLGNVGNFADSPYWSSTEYDTNEAWLQIFNTGFIGKILKLNTFNVRAIRAF